MTITNIKKMLLLVFVLGCTASKDDKLIQQSIEIHEEAMTIGKDVKEKIKQLNASADGLDSLMRSAIQDSIKTLEQAWEAWEASIVDVPGNEGHHHHDHDHHDHDHAPTPDLTPAMVLEIQQDIKKRALNLSVRTQNILDHLNVDQEK